jgi:phage I-like protein
VGFRRTVNLFAKGLVLPLGPIVAPTRVRMWEPGQIVGDFGVNVWDAAAGAEVIAAYEARGNPVPIDIEHNTNKKANPGYDPNRPPVGGGYLLLKLDSAGALWLDPIRWSDYARREIESGSRDAVSPDWDFDPVSGRPVRLNKVSLVQNPGTYGIGLLASARANGDRTMDFKMFVAALEAALEAADPKGAIQALLEKVKAMQDGAGGAGDGIETPGELAMSPEELKKGMATAAAMLRELRGSAPSLVVAPLARGVGGFDLELVKREARAAAVVALREETAKENVIASASASPAWSPELGAELRSLPLATVKRLVSALPKPVTPGGTEAATASAAGVRQGPLPGASLPNEKGLSAKEQDDISAINALAMGQDARIAAAREASLDKDGKLKVGSDGSAVFSAVATMRASAPGGGARKTA